MVALAIRNLLRRPLRTGLTLAGLSISMAVLVVLLSFGEGYQTGLRKELDRMGMQLMLVPLGCPYDAAAKVLKGRALDVTLPESALASARRDSAVAIAAPMYTAVLPRPKDGRTDLWVGIDESIRALKPWWRLTGDSTWFKGADSVILGAEAAVTEMRQPGDKLFSPETGKELIVAGVLERTGTSDDSLFFVPLATAQAMFKQPHRLTAIAIRLKDPGDPVVASEAADRLQQVGGAQVVTLTEMMGTFQNLVGSGRALVLSVAIVALVISALSVFNTMMAAVLERTREVGVLRAIGLSKLGAFRMMALESMILSLAGAAFGFVLAALSGGAIEKLVRPHIPLAPEGGLPSFTSGAALTCILLMAGIGAIAGLYPAWQASRLQPAVALRVE